MNFYQIVVTYQVTDEKCAKVSSIPEPLDGQKLATVKTGLREVMTASRGYFDVNTENDGLVFVPLSRVVDVNLRQVDAPAPALPKVDEPVQTPKGGALRYRQTKSVAVSINAGLVGVVVGDKFYGLGQESARMLAAQLIDAADRLDQ